MTTHRRFDLRTKPTSADEDMWIYYARRKHLTRFGHLLLPSSGRCYTKDMIQRTWNQWINI